jgi:hypothetical protein
MAIANTQVTNQTANPLPLPYPYKGLVFGDAVQVALLVDSPATVIANMGGAAAVRGIWSIGPTPPGSSFQASYHDQSSGTLTGGPVSNVETLSLGAVLASAATLAPTQNVFHVSGAVAIVNITPPIGLTSGLAAQITIIPDGAFTWTAAGNIGLAGTAVIGKALTFTYDGTKWWPAYIA